MDMFHIIPHSADTVYRESAYRLQGEPYQLVFAYYSAYPYRKIAMNYDGGGMFKWRTGSAKSKVESEYTNNMKVVGNGGVYISTEELAVLPEVKRMQRLAEEIVKRDRATIKG
ncbi:TPA: hypothetical protein ACQ4J9_002328 [Yersinia enterocolitica]